MWRCVAVITAGVIATLRTRTAWDEACTLARRQLPRLLDAEVGIGRCELDPLTQAVRLYGVSAYRKGSVRPLLAVDAVGHTTMGARGPGVPEQHQAAELAHRPSDTSHGACPIRIRLRRWHTGHRTLATGVPEPHQGGRPISA